LKDWRNQEKPQSESPVSEHDLKLLAVDKIEEAGYFGDIINHETNLDLKNR